MEPSQTDNKNLVPTKQTQLIGENNHRSTVPGVASLKVGPQIAIMAGIAIAVAIGVAVALWSFTPDYTLLYASVGDKEIGEVLDALEKSGMDYKIESSSGAILVPRGAVHEIRMKLAGQGLPKTNNQGFELLEKDNGMGVSQTLESARYQRALEGEIARSIMIFQNVKSARVHLALPKQSVFIRKRKTSSASVLVDLYPGRYLEKGQIESIVHLVASAVPSLESEQVTVVDQRGTLLNATQHGDGFSLSNKQFEYKNQVEDHLIERVENILTPLVGSDAMRTQITADIDFTVTERTHERYNPDLPALRSEQTQEDQSRLSAVQGVPGALSNQPPAAGTAPEVAGNASRPVQPAPLNTSRSSTRNYELDKTISHSRLGTGQLNRLTVAVVIDNLHVVQEDGTPVSKPYSQEDVTRFTELVKQAVGFDAVRGDRVTVTNAPFRVAQGPEPLPELPIWKQNWFQTLTKQLVGLLIVLALVFGVLRPTLKGLLARAVSIKHDAGAGNEGKSEHYAGPGSVGNEMGGQLAMNAAGDQPLLEAPQCYEKRLEFAQKLVDDDPKRVAQVVKNWVETDG